MDRNSAIGLVLIAVLLLLYFNFFSPQPETPTEPSQISSSGPTTDSTQQTPENLVPFDSLLAQQYGDISSLLTGEEKQIRVETGDLIVTFSSLGGRIRRAELKNFKTYAQTPLLLADNQSNTQSLVSSYEGKDIDLYKLHYQSSSSKKGDSTVVTFQADLGTGKALKHIYTVPPSGFEIKYRIESSNLSGSISGDYLTFNWNDHIPLQEKDINDSRAKTTINYLTAAGDFDGLSQTSTDLEVETLAEPIKWVANRQKFFISSIIADKVFAGGEVRTMVNPNIPESVKDANIRLLIPTADFLSGSVGFKYFFGPNDYSLLDDVAPSFSENLNLGWPPVSWVNRFVIIPIFKFLEQFIGSYGIIIIILVIIVKLILAPLSYRSYLGMAKMKLLKPELDLLKEKHGDNMTQIQQDQLKLYQQAGVNPLSGCIPLVLQMPILFAMFYFFPVSIELRQEPFLWADDLSTYDSVLDLPFSIPFYGDHVSLFVLLMTASTLIYTWQNNQISSVQGPMKSMSYAMPVIFMFVLNSFSAGLSFYYFISNLVTFAQQAIIRKFVDEGKIKAVMDDHKKKISTGTSKKSGFMSRLEEAMKTSQEAKKKGK